MEPKHIKKFQSMEEARAEMKFSPDSYNGASKDWVISHTNAFSTKLMKEICSGMIPDVPVRPFVSMMDKSLMANDIGEKYASIGARTVELDGERYMVGVTEIGLMCENVRIIGTAETPFHMHITPTHFLKIKEWLGY